jgi:hypothetical protein
VIEIVTASLTGERDGLLHHDARPSAILETRATRETSFLAISTSIALAATRETVLRQQDRPIRTLPHSVLVRHTAAAELAVGEVAGTSQVEDGPSTPTNATDITIPATGHGDHAVGPHHPYDESATFGRSGAMTVTLTDETVTTADLRHGNTIRTLGPLELQNLVYVQ